MASTKLSKRGSNKLTDRELRFAMEYLIDFNAKRAAREAGYKGKDKSLGVMACKVLARPRVAALIGKLRREQLAELELSRREILEQLYYLATRSGTDFVDEKGILIENINDLPKRAQEAIDGIEQEITTITYDDGSEVQKVKTKLRLVPKATALDMAMKHKGMFAAEKHDHRVMVLDWDALLQGPNGKPKHNGEDDPIERKILEVEAIQEGH